MALLWRTRKRRQIRNKQEISTFRQVLFGVLFFVIISLLMYGIWYVTRLPALTISTVTFEGGETVSHDSLSSIVERELTGSYLLLIPHRFVFTYPKERILEELHNVARVHDVGLERSKTNLSVSFREYVPFALICESGLESAACHFIDSEGFIFSPAPALRGGAFVRFVIDDLDIEPGIQGIEEKKLRAVTGLLSVLDSEIGFRIQEVRFDSNNDLTLYLTGGGRLIIDGGMDTQDTFANLQSVLQSESFTHIAPGNFNYIDLRFGNKIYVNEELEIATTTEQIEDPSFIIE